MGFFLPIIKVLQKLLLEDLQNLKMCRSFVLIRMMTRLKILQMPQTDILKLIFHHDQRMEALAPSANSEDDNPLLAFTKPDPTYSTLYFSGSDLENQKVGVNVLSEYKVLLTSLEKGFDGFSYFTKNGIPNSFKEAIDSIEINDILALAKEEVQSEIIHSFSGKVLRDVLERGWVIIYKREAKDGFDLQIFSEKNMYTQFFYELQAMLPDSFRFFSINGKRLSSEKKFFFETWTLNNPPHGFEEVFPESVL